MTIRLYNTRTRSKQAFDPLDADNVRMYVCGPTVYDRAHLGNARAVVVFDVLYRLLRHQYGADHVTYVRNFTDVDDKINAEALRRREAGAEGSLEELVRARSDETIRWYHEDMDALGALRPDHEPRATEWIGAMIAMIEGLVAKGHAYAAEGHVLFAVESYAEYGKLSGRSVDDMIAGARVEVAPYKRNPMDFVLWKPSDDELPGWDSPWGRGRPGWHIECSAMAHELLGASFDIHGGGTDLVFPHHENEIAQSACAHPEGEFARVWMHNEMLQVEGRKMSKSLGNFFTVRDLLESYDAEFAIPNIGPAIRLRLLQGHYRSPIDASKSYIEAAASKIDVWLHWITPFLHEEIPTSERMRILKASPVVRAVADDLNTSLAISEIDDLIGQLRQLPDNQSLINQPADRQSEVAKHAIIAIEFLGFSFDEMIDLQHSASAARLKLRALSKSPQISQRIEEILEIRKRARSEGDFKYADALREALAESDVLVTDTPDGATWQLGPNFEPSKLDVIK